MTSHSPQWTGLAQPLFFRSPPTVLSFCCTGLRLWEIKVPLYIYPARVCSFLKAANVSPSALSLPGLLRVSRAEKSQGSHREDGRNTDKLPIRLLIGSPEYGGGGGWDNGSLFCWLVSLLPAPPLWDSVQHLTSLLDCELLKGRDRAFGLCVVSFWHSKFSIKV